MIYESVSVMSTYKILSEIMKKSNQFLKSDKWKEHINSAFETITMWMKLKGYLQYKK